MKKTEGSIWGSIARGIGTLLGIVVFLVLFGVCILTIAEYRPHDVEELAIEGNSSMELRQGDEVSILTWNVGYGALGDNADFFMDGGTHVSSSEKPRVESNMEGIASFVEANRPEIIFFQEIDRDSKRSYEIDEAKLVADRMPGYENSFAYNYKCIYVPYPIPTIGKVNAGQMTMSAYNMEESNRIALPCPFKYPFRVCNLKRCLLVNRIPLADADKELVLVNLHLEAYDDGEGKIAQTKMLKELLEGEAEKGNYVIAGGDFNQIFSNIDGDIYPQVSEEMWKPGILEVESFPENLHFYMDANIPSCRSLDQPYEGHDELGENSDFQYYMLDGFIVSDNLELNQIQTVGTNFTVSDHNPVLMSVTLK